MTHYYISYYNPLSHFVEFEVQINDLNTEIAEICLPAWRPGRYQIQNFAKNIRKFNITDNEGKELSFSKTNKDTWRVETEGNKSIRVHYEYFAFTMDAGNSWLDDEQLYLNFVNCCAYEKTQMNQPCEVHLKLPQDYQIACGLRQTTHHTLFAPSYYRLVDSPMIASATLKQISYTEGEREFILWIQGQLPRSEEEIINDFKAFTQLQVEEMGEFPSPDYHFLFQCLPYKHYHGVEHWNSTVITIGPAEELSERKLYKEFLGVSSHELFHTWNVIRLRPKEMTPYDFQYENYHNTGYITEGITTYLGDLFLVQSGVFELDEYLTELDKHFKRHLEAGWNNMSVSASSFDLWLDGYEKGIPGRKVSIYTAGALAALTLDWLIRLQWNNERSIMDVMRLMWERHGVDQSGYTEDDFKRSAEEVFGDNQRGNTVMCQAYGKSNSCFEDFFNDQINGRSKHIDVLERLAPNFGLEIIKTIPESIEESHFGFRLVENTVLDIAENSPAAHQLSINDKILSIDNVPFSKGGLTDAIEWNLEIDRYGRKIKVKLKKEENAYSSNEQFFSLNQIRLKNELDPSEKIQLKAWLKGAASNI